MKKAITGLAVAALFLTALLGTTSCKKDKTTATGTVMLHLHSNIDTSEIELGEVYRDADGRQIQLSTAQFYLSNVHLKKADGSDFAIDGAYILKTVGKEEYLVGKAPVGYVYVDGTTVGDVGQVVVRDRQMLARDGILMVVVSIDRTTGELVAGPDVVSRGFVYMRQSDDLIEATKNTVRNALNGHTGDGQTQTDSAFLHRKIKDVVSDFLYSQTKRRPMVLPVVMEV